MAIPGEDLDRQDRLTSAQKLKTIFNLLYPYVRAEKRAFFQLLLATMLVSAASAAFIPILRFVLDTMIKGMDVRSLAAAFLVYIASIAIRSLGSYFHGIKTVSIRAALNTRLRIDLVKKYLSLSLDFHSNQHSGSLVNQMNSETQAVVFGFQAFSGLLRDLGLTCMLVAAAFVLNPLYTFAALLLVPPVSYLAHRALKTIGTESRALNANAAATNRLLLDTLNAGRIVRAFQGEKFECERYGSRLHEGVAIVKRLVAKRNRIAFVHGLLTLMGTGIIFFLYGKKVLSGEATVGEFFAYTVAVSSMYEPIARIFEHYSSMLEIHGTGSNLFKVLKTNPTVADSGQVDLCEAVETIEFENVSFRYPRSERQVLSDVSIRAKKGEVIAILGGNGKGKSTLLNLIPRFYDPTGGRIVLNGRDMREFKLDSLRSRIALVAQEMSLFDDTIYNNIAYGNRAATREEVMCAARAAFVDSFVQDLPLGYETRVGEKGGLLSEGQKQRIGIARALLKSAQVMILDEPTSALDVDSKAAIMAALQNLSLNRIVFIITHQPELLPPYARIVSLENGKIVETPPGSIRDRAS